jgi:2-phospho-L-lactate/phosphoenolpyruvate guanylyltransferase
MAVVAIVPLKALPDAKRRLSPALDARRRRELVATLFETVVGACLDSAAVHGVLVVAGDVAAAALARPLPVEVVLERRRGLPAAMAAAEAATRGVAATVVVMADLPFVTGGDIDTLCAAGRRGPVVVVAPARDGGTGALLRRPPDVVPTAFGRRSALAHARLARMAGVPLATVDVQGLACDVDTPEQLCGAAASQGPLRAWAARMRSA